MTKEPPDLKINIEKLETYPYQLDLLFSPLQTHFKRKPIWRKMIRHYKNLPTTAKANSVIKKYKMIPRTSTKVEFILFWFFSSIERQSWQEYPANQLVAQNHSFQNNISTNQRCLSLYPIKTQILITWALAILLTIVYVMTK